MDHCHLDHPRGCFPGAKPLGAAGSGNHRRRVGASCCSLVSDHYSRHGLDAIIGALRSGNFNLANSLVNLLLRNLTDEVTFTPLLVFAMLAFVQRLLRRDYLLPAWVLAVSIFNPRSLPRSMVIPLAMLVGIAIDEMILPAFTRYLNDERASRLAANIASTALIAFIVIRSAVLAPMFMQVQTNSLDSLSRENREAMAWAATETPPGSRFLVLTPATDWSSDQPAEWFPTLAQRTSLNTPQGAEWLPAGVFSQQVALHSAIRVCTGQNLDCLDRVAEEFNLAYEYIYIAGDLIDARRAYLLPMPIKNALETSQDYTQVYSNGPVAIFQRK